jgi:hypothetical protein
MPEPNLCDVSLACSQYTLVTTYRRILRLERRYHAIESEEQI